MKITIDFSWLEKQLAKITVTHIILLSFALHLFAMAFPSDGGMVFDEVHYIKASLATLQGIGANAEHTPLTKFLGALSISVFGNSWFAWRFPIVMCGVLSLYVFYRLALEFMSERNALYATLFLSFDTVYFIHGTILVLDMPAILLGLIAIYLYVRKRYYLTAVSGAFAFLFCEKVMYMFGAIVIYHLISHISFKRPQISIGKIVHSHSLKVLMVSLFLFFGLCFGVIGVYDAVYKPAKAVNLVVGISNIVVQDQNGNILWTETVTSTYTNIIPITDPIDHLKYAMSYFGSLSLNFTFAEGDVRQPWTWIMPWFGTNPFNSPQYFVAAQTVGNKVTKIINYVSQPTLPIWYMFIPILAVAVWKRDKFGLMYIGWVVSSFLPQIYLGLRQPQIFNYYFLYTIPALCLGIPCFWERTNLRNKQSYMFLQLLLTVVFFLVFYPVGVFR